jgi:hypothetical protein
MDSADCWRQLFCEWPKTIPREGIIVTANQETVGFVNFMVSGGILLLERDRPDSSGARKVMMAFSAITALKSTNTLDLEKYKAMGFQ